MDDQTMVKTLQELLAKEHACAIRYRTHASVVEGPYAETLKARLQEIAGDETQHQEILRDRIVALGSEPEMKVKEGDLKPARDFNQILEINIDEEKEAIREYTEVLGHIPPENAILFQAIQNIIKDEQEHLEELDAFRKDASVKESVRPESK